MGQEYSTIDPSLLVAQTRWVRSLAGHLVRDPDGAEDVAQETLLAALASPPRDAADAKRLRAWLGRVAFNLAHLSRRRNSRRRAREERAAQNESQLSAAESYVERTIEGLLGEAVGALDEPYRTAVHLRYFDGLSTSEVASRTGTTNSAVRKRLWRARAKLRKELDRRHNGERHAWFRALTPFAGLAGERARDLATAGNAAASAAAWKLAAAVPLLAFGVYAGNRWLTSLEQAGQPDGERVARLVEVEEAGPSQRRAFGPGALPNARPDAGDEGDAPHTRVQIVGLERTPEGRDSDAIELRGHVIDLWGNPLGGVDLVSSDRPASPLGRSGSNGSFTVRVPALPATLGMRTAGYTTLREARVDHGEELWEQWLVVAPAVDVSGWVVGPDGLPLANAELAVAYDESAFVDLPTLLDFSAPTHLRLADADGGFAFESIPAGRGIDLVVELGGYEPLRIAVPRLSQPGLELRLEKKTDLELLAGVVLDDRGWPLPGVEVTSEEDEVLTDGYGTFSVQVRAGSESREVMARKDGYESVSMQVDARLYDGHLRLVMMNADQSVDGEVLDEDGQPLDGWVVFAMPESSEGSSSSEGEAVAMGRTGGDGAFRLEGLARARYSLIGVDPETLLTTEACAVRGGGSPVELTARTQSVSELFPGRVVGRDGAPVANALVQAEFRMPMEGGEFVARSARARTDALGRFQLERLAAQHAQLRIDHPGVHSVQFAAARRDALRRRGETDFVVELVRPVRFTGEADSAIVLDAAGNVLALRGFTRRQPQAVLTRGRSSVFGVSSEACSVVWYRDGVEVGRHSLNSLGEELTEIDR